MAVVEENRRSSPDVQSTSMASLPANNDSGVISDGLVDTSNRRVLEGDALLLQKSTPQSEVVVAPSFIQTTEQVTANETNSNCNNNQAEPADMDAIQIDLTVSSREDHPEQAAETNDHSDHMIHQSPINNPGDDDNIGEVGMSRHNVSSSRSTEYKVTKKLVIVSTLNILLNLPRYF